MELSEEANIQLEYIYNCESGELCISEHSCHSSAKSPVIKIELENQTKESIKLSFSQAYASTARPSDVCYFSSIKHSKDSIIFENDEIYVAKEIDFKWLSDKLSLIGKIDSIVDYEDLIAGYNTENYQYIMLIVKSIKSINKRLEYYLKECYMSSNSFKTMPSNSIKLIGSQSEFSRTEIIRIFELLAINSEMEHQERMLLLIYLLKYSFEREDIDIFSEIVQFLFHLSEIRRFNDSLLFTLDDIYYFGNKKIGEKQHTEICYLIEVLNSEFIKTKVSAHVQLFYIALLSNLFCCAKYKIGSAFLDSCPNNGKLGNSSSDEEDSQSPCLKMIKDKMCGFLTVNFNSSEDSFLGRSPHDLSNDSINYIMIAFVSLIKLCDNEDEILEFIKKFKFLELISNDSEFKSSIITIEESCNQIDTEYKPAVKERDHLGVIIAIMDRIQRLDEIACVTDLKLIKYFNPHKGDSIKQDRHSCSNRTDDEAFYFCEESESEKTNLRDTETTYEHLKPPHDESIDHYCAMSLAVHFESKIESDNNPSIVTGKAKMKRTVSTGMPTSSCKPCCTIF